MQLKFSMLKGVGRRAVMLSAAIVASLPMVVWAQPQTTCVEAESTREIELALADRVAGRALPAFDRLNALLHRCPSPRVLAQLALAEQSLQRWGDAFTHIDEALREAQDPWIAAHRPELEDSLRIIREHLPQLAPQTNVPGAEVWIDGVRVGTLPLRPAYAVPTGSVTIELRARGYQTLRRVVSIDDGQIYREMLTLQPAHTVTSVTEVVPMSASPTRADEPRSPGLAQRIIGWSMLGAGIVVGGFGVWQAVAYSTEPSGGYPSGWITFQDSVNPGRQMSPQEVCASAQSSAQPGAAEARSLCDDYSQRFDLALGLGLGGAALAIAGVIVVATAPHAAPVLSSVRIGPWVTGSAQGATVGGVF